MDYNILEKAVAEIVCHRVSNLVMKWNCIVMLIQCAQPLKKKFFFHEYYLKLLWLLLLLACLHIV